MVGWLIEVVGGIKRCAHLEKWCSWSRRCRVWCMFMAGGTRGGGMPAVGLPCLAPPEAGTCWSEAAPRLFDCMASGACCCKLHSLCACCC